MPQDLGSGNGSGNGLVPSGNKPLPEPMLTKIFNARLGPDFEMSFMRGYKDYMATSQLTLLTPAHFIT